MLQIVLQILAIIGIVLLCLLGLVLLVICLVLFVPIRYNITGRKEKENIEVLVRAGWLFRLVSFWFAYPDEGANQLKVLGIPVYRLGKAKEAWEEKKKQKETKKKPKKASKKKDTKKADEASVTKKTDTAKKSAVKGQTSKEEKKDSADVNDGKLIEQTTEEAEKLSWWQKILEKIKSFIDKIKYTIRKICDTLRNINETKDYYVALFQEEETKAVLKRNKVRVFKLLKKLKPKYLNADLYVGTGSPDTTGYILALYGMFYGVFGDTISITPDFEQTVLDGTFQAKGGVRVWTLLYAGIQFYMDEELKTFIGKLKREDLEDGR